MMPIILTAAGIAGIALAVWFLVSSDFRARRLSDKRSAEYDAESAVRLATAVRDIPWLHGARTWEEARARAHVEMARLDRKRGKA